MKPQLKKRPSVVANTVKKMATFDKTNPNSSIQNRSNSSYVVSVRKNNSKLARALSMQKAVCTGLINQLIAKDAQLLKQKSICRTIQSKLSQTVASLKAVSDATINELFNATNSLLSMSNELTEAFPEDTRSTTHEHNKFTNKADDICDKDNSSEICTEEPQHTEENFQRHYAARPMIRGQVISNPCVTLQRVKIASHLSGASVSRDLVSPFNRRLSPLPEDSEDNNQFERRNTTSERPAGQRRKSSLGQNLKLPSSSVILERIDLSTRVSLSPDDSPKIEDVNMADASFGYHGDNPGVEGKVCCVRMSSTDLSPKRLRTTKDDPLEGTSGAFGFESDPSSEESIPAKKQKNKSASSSKISVLNKFHYNVSENCLNPSVKLDRLPPGSMESLSCTILDDVDMSLTECVNVAPSMGERKTIPIVQLQKVDVNMKVVGSKISSENENSSLDSSSLNIGREMYITQRVRKDHPSLETRSSLSSQSSSVSKYSSYRQKKTKCSNEENNENAPPKMISGLDGSSVKLRHSSVSLERLILEKECVPETFYQQQQSCIKVKSPSNESTGINPNQSSLTKTNENAVSHIAPEAVTSTSQMTSESVQSDISTHSYSNVNEREGRQSKRRTRSKSTNIQQKRSKSSGGQMKAEDTEKSQTPASPCSSTHSHQSYSSDSESSSCAESRAFARRTKQQVSYKEPSLNRKMRRC